jgi:hypothetical protein
MGAPFVKEDVNRTYNASDCPGIDPPSDSPLPIIRTLLSIPFTLLHNVPRLSGMVPRSQYQRDLLRMAEEIIYLWSWDPNPSPAKVEEWTIHAAQGNLDPTRAPPPAPIADRNDTFESMRPTLFLATIPAANCRDSMVRPKSDTFGTGGEVSISHTTGFVLHLSAWDGEQPGMDCNEADLLPLCESLTDAPDRFSSAIAESINGSCNSQDLEDKPRDPSQYWFPSEILAWSNMVIEADDTRSGDISSKMSPLTHTYFEKGVIGGLSTNDILMIKGLIDPGVYVRYLHLELFSMC